MRLLKPEWFVLLKIPARGVCGAWTGPRFPRDATAAAWRLAAERLPGSSVRKGWACTGRLVAGFPGRRAIGVSCPTLLMAGPDGPGLAPRVGMVVSTAAATSAIREVNTRATRGMRATVRLDIAGPSNCATEP